MTLRSKLIRLAHQNPELRGEILPLLKTAAMSEAEFWKLIAPYGWGKKTTDTKAIKKSLMGKLSPEEAESVRKTFHSLGKPLTKAVQDYEDKLGIEFGLGDDSFGDLIAHIIGMGEKEYEAVLKNPALAAERARKGQFTESFSYALPMAQNYANLNVATYLEWAKRIIGEYEQVLNASEDDVPWKSKLNGPLKEVVTTMKDFLRTKDVAGLLEKESSTKKAAEEIGKTISKLGLGMSLPEEGTIESALKNCANKWMVWNLFGDLRDYMT